MLLWRIESPDASTGEEVSPLLWIASGATTTVVLRRALVSNMVALRAECSCLHMPYPEGDANKCGAQAVSDVW